jgi:hypothetical protein
MPWAGYPGALPTRQRVAPNQPGMGNANPGLAARGRY